MEVALIGKSGLIADVGYLIPGAQAAPGVLDPRHIDKAGWRQAGILLKDADQGLFAQRKFVGQRIQRKRYSGTGRLAVTLSSSRSLLP